MRKAVAGKHAASPAKVDLHSTWERAPLHVKDHRFQESAATNTSSPSCTEHVNRSGGKLDCKAYELDTKGKYTRHRDKQKGICRRGKLHSWL